MVYFDTGYIAVVACSGYRRSSLDPGAYWTLLAPNAGDFELGCAVDQALSASRFLTLSEAESFFDPKESELRIADWVALMVRRAAKSSRRHLFMSIGAVMAIRSEGAISLMPTRRKRAEVHIGMRDRERLLPAGINLVSLGAQTRAAMEDCG